MIYELSFLHHTISLKVDKFHSNTCEPFEVSFPLGYGTTSVDNPVKFAPDNTYHIYV